MLRFHLYAFAFILLGVLRPVSAADRPFPPVGELLPLSSVKAHLVQARSSPEVIAITKKMSQAISLKPDWWKTYIKDNADKRPLPYHENFGITVDEYKQMLGSAKQMRLVKVGNVDLGIKRTKETIELTIHGANKVVQPVVFDLKKGSMASPMATVESAKKRTAGEDAGLLGPHQSHAWNKVLGDPKTGTFQRISFTLGRVAKTGNTFIQYSAAKMKEGKPEMQFQVLIFVDMNK